MNQRFITFQLSLNPCCLLKWLTTLGIAKFGQPQGAKIFSQLDMKAIERGVWGVIV